MKRLVRKSAKQVGTLYHFTGLTQLIGILESNFLGNANVSLTRDQNFNSVSRNISGDCCCRITLNGDLLSEKYKIKPFHDGEFLDDNFGKNNLLRFEYEERIESRIENIKMYITDITLYRNKGLLKRIDNNYANLESTANQIIMKSNGKMNISESLLSADNIAKSLQSAYGIPVNIQ